SASIVLRREPVGNPKLPTAGCAIPNRFRRTTLTGKFKLTLATIVAFGALQQTAYASCSGTGCSSFSVEGKTFSSSGKRAKATLVNKDPAKKLHIEGCITSDGKCGSGDMFKTTIEAGKRIEISGPATDKFVVDVTSAELIAPPPPALPGLTKTD